MERTKNQLTMMNSHRLTVPLTMSTCLKKITHEGVFLRLLLERQKVINKCDSKKKKEIKSL